ncbi:Hypothetical protein (Fragment) [Durusdinium trenchii]|uniref:Uncharacterized protein n=1 Tax=Durusdinium trenchii TaxID=1381693 RepID=A0ABP0RXX1_9DINO
MADGRAAVAATAWRVPKDLERHAERILSAAQANWGSIEVLSKADGTDWLFFDLNLSCISTMPDPALIADPEKLWPPGFDPYASMASWIKEHGLEVRERPQKASRC